jgi:hypothetical protein
MAGTESVRAISAGVVVGAVERRTLHAQRQPNLDRKPAHIIKPSAGPAAQLETLADAAQLIADLDLSKHHSRDQRVAVGFREFGFSLF